MTNIIDSYQMKNSVINEYKDRENNLHHRQLQNEEQCNEQTRISKTAQQNTRKRFDISYIQDDQGIILIFSKRAVTHSLV